MNTLLYLLRSTGPTSGVVLTVLMSAVSARDAGLTYCHHESSPKVSLNESQELSQNSSSHPAPGAGEERKILSPSQRQLDELFARAKRVRIIFEQSEHAIDISDPQEIHKLHDCLSIVEGSNLGVIFDLGNPGITLYDEHGQIIEIRLFGLMAMRLVDGPWNADAPLSNGLALGRWLAAHGISEPLKEYEQLAAAQRQADESARKWLQAMPECLRTYWLGPTGWNIFTGPPQQPSNESAKMETSTKDSRDLLTKAELDGISPGNYDGYAYPAVKLKTILEDKLPEKKAQILALLHWFGSGKGPWSGFPSYEKMPEDILIRIPTSDLVSAISADALTDKQLEGAARYFSGRAFYNNHPDGLKQLPASLKRQLLECSIRSPNVINRNFAEKAFGPK